MHCLQFFVTVNDVPESHHLRDRILDAAEDYVLSGGYSTSKMLSTVAQRAGVSRPTIYKYVGDRQAINAALVERHLADFLPDFAQVVARDEPPRAHLISILTFVVDYARTNKLLEAAVRDAPDQTLPQFTLYARAAFEQVRTFALPVIEALTAERQVDADAVIDWLCRVAVSLVFTVGLVPTTTPDEVRRHLEVLFDIPALLSG